MNEFISDSQQTTLIEIAVYSTIVSGSKHPVSSAGANFN